MPPKKTTAAAENTPATDATPASTAPTKKAPAKRGAKKDILPADAAEGPKKRNMTAVPSDFVSQVQNQLPEDLAAKLKVKDVKEICELFVKTLVDKVKAGQTVSFTNNMTFKRQVRNARTYKNLKTGEAINKPPHYVLSMQVKPALKKVFDDLVVGDESAATVPATEDAAAPPA
jgi:nucleoid DNA-binding protein